MLRHVESIKRVEELRLVPSGDYFIFEVDVTTSGGIRKTLRLPHLQADLLRSKLVGELEEMDPDTRRRSFTASAKAFR